MKITDKFPMTDGKYLCLENNKLYTNPRTIINLLVNKYNMTVMEYAIKWNLLDKDDYVICKICNNPCDSIGKHLNTKHKEYGGIDKYKEEFGKDVQTLSTNYKKYLKNKMIGKNNHNHKSNTTELERQQISPFSLEFWKLKHPNKSDEELNNLLLTFRDSALSDREFNTRLDYYIKRGYTQKEGLKLIKERQRTVTLEKYIQKYGNKQGNKKWQKHLYNISKRFVNGYSKISQELFIELYLKIKHLNYDIYFANLTNKKEIELESKNFEYILILENTFIRPDFFIKDKNLIIEFDGTYFHRKTPENIKRENERDELIDRNNYIVLHISEHEYKKNKKETINKCLSFINNN